MSRTNADLLLDILEGAGVDIIFTCPGTTEVPLLAASVGRSRPQFKLTTHEGIAVSAADGYSRSTGKIGVALLHANVGLANGLAMMEAAKQGRSRVLVLNGTKPLSTRNKRGFTQSPESVSIATPFTVQATSVNDEAGFYTDVLDAMARLHRPGYGPVYLELPQDILATPTQLVAEDSNVQLVRWRPSKGSLDQAAKVLEKTEQIAVVAGSDLAQDEAVALMQLAETIDAPIFEAPWRELERDTIPTKHDAYAGVLSYGASYIDGTTLLVIGTPAFQEPDAGESLLKSAENVIHVVNSSENLIHSAVVLAGDHGEAISELQQLVEQSEIKSSAEFLTSARQSYLQQVIQATTTEESTPLKVADVAGFLGEYALSGPVVLDAVTASAVFLKLTPRGPDAPFFATGSGALGWGTGAAVGIALAGQHKRVFAIVSDGVFQFGIQALHTACAEQLPITFIVINNQAYNAVVLALQKYDDTVPYQGEYPCTQLGDTNIATIAVGFGMNSNRVTTLSELEAALVSEEEVSGPSLIEVMVSAEGAGNTLR